MGSDLAGKTISHFRILEKLGAGGMGVVYRAEDTRLRRTVALKFISRHLLNSDDAVLRFVREAQAAAACEHPNVCTIYEVGDSDEGTFIAMACIEGRSLKEQIASGALSVREAVDIAVQVTRGLDAAHRRGIVHRDIKPGNIMITPDGVAKVMDFGLARPPEATQLTKAGSTVGTIAYMSPEQTRGQNVDARSDIWALGVVLHEMISGHRPFHGGHDQAIVHSILHDEPDPITDAQPGISAELERIIVKALAKSPTERYQHAEEMLEDLLALSGGVADSATRPLEPRGSDSTCTNLPLQLTSFVGRDDAVVKVRTLLGGNRLFTLTGAGGCGKTRLALEVGRSALRDFPDGVWLAELAALREPALVPPAVAAALGLLESPNQTPTETLVNHLQRKSLLLVLDNCEHLLGACAELVDRLLRTCPNIHLLATSREPLAITGETVFRVPSLAVPNAEEHLPLAKLADLGAVRLFIERAAASEAGFQLTNENASAVAEISRRLDGIPLALELAAARIKVLPASEIARRLEDRFALLSVSARTAPPRHQTLRALVDWSYEQLSDREQVLLGRLSAFAGGWTLDSAEAVCSDQGITGPEVIELMLPLVEKSLVEKLAGHETAYPRYRMHETIREYARDHLSEDREALATRRHRDHFLELAEESEPHMSGGPDQAAWLRRLAAERENLRAAFDTCMRDSNGALVGLRLAGAMGPYWEIRGNWDEGRTTCAKLLALPGAQGRTAARAKALRLAGSLARRQGDYAEARELLEEGLAISREIDDPQGIAESTWHLGVVVWREDDTTGAGALYEESLAIARDLQDKRLVSRCLNSMATLEEDRETRRALYLESLKLSRQLQDRNGEAVVLCNLGSMIANIGKYEEGLSLLEEGLAIYRELDLPRGVALTLLFWADIAVDLGELTRAREFCEEGLQLTRRLGARHWESYALSILGRAARLEGDLDRARRLYEEDMPIAKEAGGRSEAHAFLGLGLVCLESGEHDRARKLLADSLLLYWKYLFQRGAADALEGLGALALTVGESTRAARLFGAADALREEYGCPIHPVDRSIVDQRLSAVRRELGERAFEREWAAGRALSGKQVTEYACSPANGG